MVIFVCYILRLVKDKGLDLLIERCFLLFEIYCIIEGVSCVVFG